ncbi:MAG TPA: DUF2784 domain-containing protein [Gammaproteobacteria bacterium]|jgi:polyferredoxin
MFDSPATAEIAADAVLVVHAAFIAFVVFGQVYVLLGWGLGWRSARNRWFRRLHLAAIGIVVIQAWIGMTCPLTSLESAVRAEAGARAYPQGFIAHWLSRLIYYDLPTWIFVLVYSLFGALVLLSYWRFPPLPGSGKRGASVTRP